MENYTLEAFIARPVITALGIYTAIIRLNPTELERIEALLDELDEF